MRARLRLVAAALLVGAAIPVLAQESILPPGFGDPAADGTVLEICVSVSPRTLEG